MSKYQSHQKKDSETYNPSIIKLSGWVDKEVRVRFVGGRTITGTLKGSDNANNMIVDDTIEYLRGNITRKNRYNLDPDDPYKITDKKRELGLIFVKGSLVIILIYF